MKKYSAECDICKRPFEHEKELVLRQMIGFHKLKVHGIPGVTSLPETKRMNARLAYWRKMGYSEQEIALRQARYEAKQSTQNPAAASGPPVKKPKASDAVPLPLTECPKCHIRFWYTEPRKDSE